MQSPMHDDQKETMAAADPLDFLQCPETLHPDLQRHFRDGPVGKMLHHPFIINVMTLPGHHKADNMMYLHRKEEAERSWHQKTGAAISHFMSAPIAQRRYSAFCLRAAFLLTSRPLGD